VVNCLEIFLGPFLQLRCFLEQVELTLRYFRPPSIIDLLRYSLIGRFSALTDLAAVNHRTHPPRRTRDYLALLIRPFPAIQSNGRPTGIAINKNGEAVLAGNGVSSSFPTTSNAYQQTYMPAAEPVNAGSFFSMFNPAGSQLVYSSFLNGTAAGQSSTTQIMALALDSSGNIWLKRQRPDIHAPSNGASL
jgi:hypothetical protein